MRTVRRSSFVSAGLLILPPSVHPEVGADQRPGNRRSSFAESRDPLSSGLSLPVEQREFCIFEDAQSVASRRQLEEPLISKGEIQQDVTRADAKHQ